MNWRADIITNESIGLQGLFSAYKEDGAMFGSIPGFKLATVGAAFVLDIKSKDENLPAVSFGFGNNRATDTATTERESGIFQVYIYAEVKKESGVDIIKSTGDMYTCVQQVANALKTYGHEDVDIQRVRIDDERAPEIKIAGRDFLLFTLRIEYEEFVWSE